MTSVIDFNASLAGSQGLGEFRTRLAEANSKLQSAGQFPASLHFTGETVMDCETLFDVMKADSLDVDEGKRVLLTQLRNQYFEGRSQQFNSLAEKLVSAPDNKVPWDLQIPKIVYVGGKAIEDHFVLFSSTVRETIGDKRDLTFQIRAVNVLGGVGGTVTTGTAKNFNRSQSMAAAQSRYDENFRFYVVCVDESKKGREVASSQLMPYFQPATAKYMLAKQNGDKVELTQISAMDDYHHETQFSFESENLAREAKDMLNQIIAIDTIGMNGDLLSCSKHPLRSISYASTVATSSPGTPRGLDFGAPFTHTLAPKVFQIVKKMKGLSSDDVKITPATENSNAAGVTKLLAEEFLMQTLSKTVKSDFWSDILPLLAALDVCEDIVEIECPQGKSLSADKAFNKDCLNFDLTVRTNKW